MIFTMDELDIIEFVPLAQKGLMVNRLKYRLLHMHEMNLNDRLGKKGLKITIPNKVEAEDSSKLSTFSCWIGDEEEGIVSSGSGGFG